MISLLHLLWICPVSIFIGVMLIALLVAGDDGRD